MIFELLVLSFFSFIIRFLFVSCNASDTYIHLWTIKKCKYNKVGGHTAFNSIIPGACPYSSLLHWIYSFFPQERYVLVGYIGNILFDVIAVVLVYFLTWGILENTLKDSVDFGVSISFVAAAIYSCTPILLPITARLKSIGARTFGNLVFIAYLIGLWFYFQSHDYLYLFLFALLTFVALMSSQFAVQVIILLPVPVGVFYGEYLPLIIPPITLCFLYFVDIFGSRAVLIDKVNFYIWYFKWQSKVQQISSRNLLKDLILFPVYLIFKRNKIEQVVLLDSTVIILLYSVPQFFALVYFAWLGNSHPSGMTDIVEFFKIVTLSGCVLFVLTSLKKLLFLGQAERYFEYTLIPITLLFVIECLLTQSYSLLWLFLFLNLTISLCIYAYSVKSQISQSLNDNKNAEFGDVLEYLSAISDNKNALVLPTKNAYDFANYVQSEKLKLYYPYLSFDQPDGYKYMLEDEEELYHLKPDFSKLDEKYGVDYIVLCKSSLSEHWFQMYELASQKAGFEVKLSNQDYVVYGK